MCENVIILFFYNNDDRQLSTLRIDNEENIGWPENDFYGFTYIMDSLINGSNSIKDIIPEALYETMEAVRV